MGREFRSITRVRSAMNIISLPPSLLKFSDGAASISVDGHTLEAAREKLESLHPSLYKVLFCDQGKLQPYVNIFVDGWMVDRSTDLGNLQLRPNSRIDVLLAVAGG